MVTISVCMIVKNEEKVLARCLDSLKGLWEELIIVDTGSTDKTLDVSKPADDYHIYGFEWTPDGMNGYFDGVLVWRKNVSVNYRMLMWISLNSHAYETYTTDAKSHYIDYVRIWKTEELEALEKQLVTKNIVQKQAPTESNIATLAYAGANGLRSSHYQTYDP